MKLNPPVEVTPGGPDDVAREFQQRVEAYMRLRDEAGRGLLPFEPNSSPGAIDAAQKLVAARVRERRADARQGDIFTPEIRTHIRRVLAGPLTGPRQDSIRSVIQEEAPDPGAIPRPA